MTRCDNPAAFPSPEIRLDDGTGISAAEYGMTLRDWFAGQALSAIFTHGTMGRGDADAFAQCAYIIADAMLDARESSK